MSWQSRAACRGMDTELFFSDSKHDRLEAIAVCGRCAVRDECLQFAADMKVGYGVFGGKDKGAAERERRCREEMKRREQRVA